MKAMKHSYRIHGPNPPPSEGNAELTRIQTATCLMTEESMRATREMLRLCHASQDAGAATLAMLHQQGDQLNRTEGALDAMHVGLVGAEDNLIQMTRSERCCGGGCFCFQSCCVCCSRRLERTPWKSQTLAPAPAVLSQPTKTRLDDGDHGVLVPSTNEVKEDPVEANLTEVSNLLGNMRKAATEMGSEINTHNAGIDRMNTKADSNQIRMVSTQDKTDDLLKS